MKSRISFFNQTVFRKNLTRFAPAWVLYTVFQGMVLILNADGNPDYYLAHAVADCAQIMCVFTPMYALLCAQLLFGDLYNTRMCNAIHAMPLRRETWFGTNVLSGFVFHLIPTAIAGVLYMVLIGFLSFTEMWTVGLLWVLTVNLQFVIFFGLAVFSAFCVGNRFAQAVVYGILNFGSLIAGWMVTTLYTPLYYGIRTNTEPFYRFSPFARLAEESILRVEHVYDGYDGIPISAKLHIMPNFYYLLICAAVGVVLIALAMGMYRRRKLESAGDFMAIRKLEPVFLVIYTLVMGAVFHFVAAEMFGMDTMFFLFLGIAIGWFTGRMLLERTTRVFRKKSLLHCGIVMAAMGASLLIAAMDPFGIESWIPRQEEVESVTIADGHYTYHDCEATLETDEEIRWVIAIHQEALAEYETEDSTVEIAKEDRETMDYDIPLTIEYRLTGGRTVKRYYYVWMGGETGDDIRALFSSPECVFRTEVDIDVDAFLAENTYVTLRDTCFGNETVCNDPEALRSLMEAILADCRAGTMAQDWDFHNGGDSICWLNFGDTSITVWTDSENTMQWLRDNGIDVDTILELYGS